MYLRARYYEPALSRFSQKDIDRGTVANPKSLNRYLYTWNNPVSYVDLDGQRVTLPLNLGGGSSSKKVPATKPSIPKPATKCAPVSFQEQPVSTSANKVQSVLSKTAIGNTAHGQSQSNQSSGKTVSKSSSVQYNSPLQTALLDFNPPFLPDPYKDLLQSSKAPPMTSPVMACQGETVSTSSNAQNNILPQTALVDILPDRYSEFSPSLQHISVTSPVQTSGSCGSDRISSGIGKVGKGILFEAGGFAALAAGAAVGLPTIAAFGAAVFIASAVCYGYSQTEEGLNEIYLGIVEDNTSKAHNSFRDDLFGGNQELYDFWGYAGLAGSGAVLIGSAYAAQYAYQRLLPVSPSNGSLPSDPGTALMESLSNERLDKIYTHVFSADHINKGIMNLGNTPEDILHTFFSIAAESSQEWAEGSNEIRTVINGVETTIRFFVNDGEIINLDGFTGYSGRVLGNLIAPK